MDCLYCDENRMDACCPRCGKRYCFICPRIAELEAENADLKAEIDCYRNALIMHRADLHQYSTRPCPTCRASAEVLGISSKVPNTCADRHKDRIALEAEIAKLTRIAQDDAEVIGGNKG